MANDRGDPHLSIARARVAPGGTTAWHSLDGVVERYIIISGRGRVEIGDRTVDDVGPGDVVRIPENMKQRITNISSEDLIFFAVCTPPFSKERYRNLET